MPEMHGGEGREGWRTGEGEAAKAGAEGGEGEREGAEGEEGSAGGRDMSEHYAETKYGFEWGSASISRGFSDERKGWVTFLFSTPKHSGHNALQIYVTRTGKIRIHGMDGEWTPPKKKANHEQKRKTDGWTDAKDAPPIG